MAAAHERTVEELDEGLALVRRESGAAGTLELIVARPGPGARAVLESGTLDPALGLVGDRWSVAADGREPDLDVQITLADARVLALVAGERERWPLAGDQLYVDFDLSEEALPAGARLAVGEAVLAITAVPHTGCAQYAARFGREALRWASTPRGLALRLRGVHARVEVGGVVRRGDAVRRIG